MYSFIIMRLLNIWIIVTCVTANSLPKQRWVTVTDDSGLHTEVVDLEKELAEMRLKEREVLFYYKSRQINNPVATSLNNTAALAKTDYNPDRATYFIIHGWKNDHTSPLNALVSEALLSQQDCNLFLADWGATAHLLYALARAAMPVVGRAAAEYAIEIGVRAELTRLIGHSMGAHAAGIAGHQLQPAELVALDPAWPLFEATPPDGRLDPGDAHYVQVVHTSMLSFEEPLGHADFYPAGGRVQPGCGEDLLSSCAHSRSYKYYAESLRTKGFTSIQCRNYETYKAGHCAGNPTSPMGGLSLDVTSQGTYYLDVNPEEPFSKG